MQAAYEKSKKESDDLKMFNEEKLTMQEEEQNDEIQMIESKNQKEISRLDLVNEELKKEIQTIGFHKERLTVKKEVFERKTKAEKLAI